MIWRFRSLRGKGTYEQFLEAQASLSIDPETRENFLNFFQPDNLRKLFEKENVITYECHVIRDGKPEWENIIATCLEKRMAGLSRYFSCARMFRT